MSMERDMRRLDRWHIVGEFGLIIFSMLGSIIRNIKEGFKCISYRPIYLQI